MANTELDLARIIETFEILPDWESRYQYLDEIGSKLDDMGDAQRNDDNQVKECMSLVWVNAKKNTAQPELIDFTGDCNTSTIKGVVAVFVALFSAKTNAQVQAIDIDEVFKDLNLFENLSPSRHVGVYAIERKMKRQAQALIDA